MLLDVTRQVIRNDGDLRPHIKCRCRVGLSPRSPKFASVVSHDNGGNDLSHRDLTDKISSLFPFFSILSFLFFLDNSVNVNYSVYVNITSTLTFIQSQRRLLIWVSLVSSKRIL